MAIIDATETGGIVPCTGGTQTTANGARGIKALSWREVEEIRERFTTLNPYTTPETAGSLLELEDENFTGEIRQQRHQLWCYSISAKRYALYTKSRPGKIKLEGITGDDEPDDYDDTESAIRKPSQHGLGHLLNPLDPTDESRDWITEIWTQILTDAQNPVWADGPAVARTSVSTPTMRLLLAQLNHDKPYAEQIKPFNFLSLAFVDPTERPADDSTNGAHRPIREQSTRVWVQRPWVNRFNGHTYNITTTPSNGVERDGLVTVKTYGDVVADYATHPEPKSLSSTGSLCDRRTVGILTRRTVTPTIMVPIGKESNRLEETQIGLLDSGDQPLNTYGDRQLQIFHELAIPILRHLGIRETARQTGHSVAAVSAALNRTSQPRKRALDRYLAVATEYASSMLEARNLRTLDPARLLRAAADAISQTD